MNTRGEPYAAFASAYRGRLIGAAALVHLDADRAPAVADAALAEVYASWPRLDDPYAAALRLVLTPRTAEAGARQAARAFELVDVATTETRPAEDIRSELGVLSGDERRILVLARYIGLPPGDIAALLRRDTDDITAQLAAAEGRLRDLPRRHVPRRLAAELADAARSAQPPDRADAGSSDRAATAGRSTLRLRRLRLGAVALVLIIAAGFGIRQALSTPAPLAGRDPSSVPSATATPVAPCDTTDPVCRVDVVSAWRAEMADVISEHLDPAGRYFTGYSYSYTEDYLGSGFFGGPGGALALDLYRMRDGATEVHLQIATSREYALRCGTLTKRPCSVIRFMDGNNYALTDPYDVAHGLEVQQRPEGTFVITVVARNTSKAKQQLDLTRGDLVTLISDPRLRLPPR